MSEVELLKQAQEAGVKNSEGKQSQLQLKAGMSDGALSAFRAELSRPTPANLLELLKFTCGFDNPFGERPFERVDFSGQGFLFSAEDAFPHGLPMANDIFGNHWLLDLGGNESDGYPVYYACNDPPVFALQAESLEEFIEQLLVQKPLTLMYDEVVGKIWDLNPDFLSYKSCLSSEDKEANDFAQSLDSSYLFIDLRHARFGDGFSWGRFGHDTVVKRAGRNRIFAVQQKKLSWMQKLFGV